MLNNTGQTISCVETGSDTNVYIIDTLTNIQLDKCLRIITHYVWQLSCCVVISTLVIVQQQYRNVTMYQEYLEIAACCWTKKYQAH